MHLYQELVSTLTQLFLQLTFWKRFETVISLRRNEKNFVSTKECLGIYESATAYIKQYNHLTYLHFHCLPSINNGEFLVPTEFLSMHRLLFNGWVMWMNKAWSHYQRDLQTANSMHRTFIH